MRGRAPATPAPSAARGAADAPTFGPDFKKTLAAIVADVNAHPALAALARGLSASDRLTAAAWAAAAELVVVIARAGGAPVPGAGDLLAGAVFAGAARADAKRGLGAARALTGAAWAEFEAAVTERAIDRAAAADAASTAAARARALHPLLALVADDVAARCMGRAATAMLGCVTGALGEGRAPPEDRPDAAGAAVYLLTAHGPAAAAGAGGGAAIAAAGDAMVAILRDGGPGEAAAAAGSGVAAAAALPDAPPGRLAAELAAGLFDVLVDDGDDPLTGPWHAALAARGESLATALAALPPARRLAAARGVLASAPAAIVCARVVVGGRPWTLVVDGGAVAGAAAVARGGASADDAVLLLAAALARLAREWAAVEGAAPGEEGDGDGDAPPPLASLTLGDCERGPSAPPTTTLLPPHLPPATLTSIINASWPLLEDGGPRPAAAAHAALASALDALDAAAAADPAAAPAAAAAYDVVADRVAAMEPWRPGRHAAVSALARRRGAADRLFAPRPQLLADAFAALGASAAAAPAGKALGDAVAALGRGRGGAAAARSSWVPPLLAALKDPARRSAAAAHALPACLRADPGAAPALAAGAGGDAAPLVAVLSAARRLGGLPDLQACVNAAEEEDDCRADVIAVPLAPLVAAARCADPDLRAAALALAADDGTTARLPSPAELAIATAGLLAGMRGADDAPRRRSAELGRRLLARVRAGSAAVIAARAGRGKGGTGLDDDASLALARGAADWHAACVQGLVDALHPGAHHARRWVAARLLASLAGDWRAAGAVAAAKGHPPPALGPAHLGGGGGAPVPPSRGAPGDPPLAPLVLLPPDWWSPATIATLLAAGADSWDKLREAAVDALAARAASLAASPRAREADAGARLLGLLHSSYVLEGGWGIEFGAGWAPRAVPPPSNSPPSTRSIALLHSVLDAVAADLAAGAADPDAAARRGLACASLRCARALLAGTPWGELEPNEEQAALDRASSLAQDALACTATLLASPQAALAGAADVDAGGVGYGAAADAGDTSAPSPPLTSGGASLLRLSAAWRTGREAAAVADAVARAGDASTATLTSIGASLSSCLQTCKHVGVLDAATVALAAACASLLARGDVSPRAWLAAWTARANADGQGLDDVVRRSAGVPCELVALLRGEVAAVAGPCAAVGDAVAALVATLANPSRPWPARVHAAHALRVVVDDACLSTATAFAAVPALAACLAALGAPGWEVRNAAGLTAASLVRRVAGAAAPVGAPAARAPTPSELWRRHPGLAGVLEAAVRDGAAVAPTAAAPPRALGVALALLSRLRPPRVADDSCAALAAHVRACASARDAGVRALAAAALPPLVPAGRAADAAAAVAEGLPRAGAPVASHNEAHGRLLQISALLKAAAWPAPGGGPPAGAGDARAVAAAAAALAPALWLTAPAMGCVPVRAAAIDAGASLVAAADGLLPGRVAPAEVDVVAAATAAASRAALAAATAGCGPVLGGDALQSSAAAALAAGRAGAWPAGADARAAARAPDPNARAASFDALCAHVDSSSHIPDYVGDLVSGELARGWRAGAPPDAPTAALRLWARVAATADGLPPVDVLASILASAAPPPDARAAALAALGRAVGREPEAAPHLTAALAGSVAPSSDDAERAAAAGALADCGLLPALRRGHPHPSRAHAAAAWAASLTLLQDEDDAVRAAAAAATAAAVGGGARGPPPDAPSALAGVAAHVAMQGGDTEVVRDALLAWMHECVVVGGRGVEEGARDPRADADAPHLPRPSPASSSIPSTHGRLRLFDLDPDNAAAEPLLASHAACAAAAAAAAAGALPAALWAPKVGLWAAATAVDLQNASAAVALDAGAAWEAPTFLRAATAAAALAAAAALPGASEATDVVQTALAAAVAAVAAAPAAPACLAAAVGAAARAWGVPAETLDAAAGGRRDPFWLAAGDFGSEGGACGKVTPLEV